jgi:hypothetical protein
MVPIFQRSKRRCVARWSLRALPILFVVISTLASVAVARAQDAPANTVGRIEGLDVSVEGGASAGNGTLSGAPSIFVVNGGVVTVHSGQAQLRLLAGGKVDVCGPAKFTVLQSGAAITLALNFGKLRIQLPGATSLRIFTPTIIATPLDISGAARDITVGLELNDSLCVRASSGALQLEHQFTGEKLVVPQDGEFFLAEGKLLPVAQTPGTCQCAEMQARAVQHGLPVQPVPEVGHTSPVVAGGAPAPGSAATSKAQAAAEPPIELSVPTHEDAAKKPAEAAKTEPPPAPAIEMPEYTAIAPPLVFSADSPSPPPGASSDTILLVRVAHIFPDWEFSGHVDAPPLAAATPGTGVGQSPSQSAKAPATHKAGFWSAVKRFFGGKS